MPQFDLSLAELQRYRVTTPEPHDLDDFWQSAIGAARAVAQPMQRRPYLPDVYGERLLVEDITFSGADGDPIRAWFIAPKDAAPRSLACRVTFVGY